MNSDFLIFVLREGIKTILTLLIPMLIIPMIIGLVISVFQAVTQIQDQLQNFFPKLVVMFLLLSAGMPLTLNILSKYFVKIMADLPNYI